MIDSCASSSHNEIARCQDAGTPRSGHRVGPTMENPNKVKKCDLPGVQSGSIFLSAIEE
jgi:hypothetical protein